MILRKPVVVMRLKFKPGLNCNTGMDSEWLDLELLIREGIRPARLRNLYSGK